MAGPASFLFGQERVSETFGLNHDFLLLHRDREGESKAAIGTTAVTGATGN